ncbi:MAG: tetratricopeptide repeat protein [Candidatus Mcinerneyibacterium aminivorans]|uniref:Tetratricopeptide repeat protein n=1 Tax=Candidatus Mcinerneyibacterium aminivorans TaxID=2703815 RepID=A0A5D0MBF0_9BACT|nr:MAG: tetratricopeptide repeat protein [Candidatus Mcinerneyibacterium aminivorans]
MEKIEKLLQKLEDNPNNVDLLLQIAETYYDKEDFKNSIRFYQRITELDEENEKAYFNLGAIYGKLALEDIQVDEYWEDHTDEEDFFENAIKNYMNCVEINPENKYAYNNLAIIYDALDWQDKAKEMIEKSLEIDPGQDDLRDMLNELEL